MSKKVLLKSSFWERNEEDPYYQQLKFYDINAYGFFLFWIITNFEILILIFMLVSTFMSCCKKKNNNQINVTTNPPSDNGTEDLVAGVPANNTTGGNYTTGNGTTIPTITTAGTVDGSSIRPEATTKPNKSEIKEAESKKEKTKPKSQIKTAKAMPKNVWELAYPATTETVDEAANTKGHTATKE